MTGWGSLIVGGFAGGESPLVWGVRVARLRRTDVRVHLVTLVWMAAVLLSSLPRDAIGVGYASIGLAVWIAVVAARGLACGVCRRGGVALVWPIGAVWEDSGVGDGWPCDVVGLCATSLVAFGAAGVMWGMGWLGSFGPGVPAVLNPLVPGASLADLAVRGGGGAGAVAVWWAYAIGMVLTAAHCVPARPTDGARLMERWLGRSGDGVAARRATNAAGLVGAALVVVGGVVLGSTPAIGLGLLMGVVTWWDLRLISMPQELAMGLAGSRPDTVAEATDGVSELDGGVSSPDQGELDRVLEKIAEGGMASLSRRELRFLKAETARRRDG